jgi:hypothetical protein
MCCNGGGRAKQRTYTVKQPIQTQSNQAIVDQSQQQLKTITTTVNRQVNKFRYNRPIYRR